MSNSLLVHELRELLAENNAATLAEILEEFHPASFAELSDGLTADETWRLLGYGSLERQAEIFSFYEPAWQAELVAAADDQRISQLLGAMSHDDRVDLFQELDPPTAERLLNLLRPADRADVQALMSYPEGVAGSLMTTDCATLPPNITVSEALTRLRAQASALETIYYIYVVEEDRRLVGFVSLRDLVLAEPSMLVRDLMQEEVITVNANADQEDVAFDLAKYNFLAIPVVDHQHRLLGIVTHDDIADVLEDEATEDFHLASAVAPLEKGYDETSLWALYHRRIGWLLVLVFVNLVSSGVIAAYEETLQAMLALAFFLPLLIDSGGNTGSQAATLIIRALATDEVEPRHWRRVLFKELGVGLLLGVSMAVASALLGFFRGGVEVGLIVGLSMLCIVAFTNLVGVVLPFILTRMKFDPAVASSPLITTVADATGLMIYFTIATQVLRWNSGA